RLKQFTQREGVTSMLKVEKDNTVEDVFDTAYTTGGVICEMDNSIGELIDKLAAYYEKTGNKRLLKRLDSLNK
ncbi:MAG: hypothetical protein AABY22_24500, partial [Nanoarchaeota archaeon]